MSYTCVVFRWCVWFCVGTRLKLVENLCHKLCKWMGGHLTSEKIIIKVQFYERWLTLLYWYLLHMPQHWLKSLMLSSPRSQKTNLTRFELWHGIKPRGQELRCTTMIAWLYNIKRVRKEFLLFKLKVKVPSISPTDLIWTYFNHLTLNSSARPGGA